MRVDVTATFFLWFSPSDLGEGSPSSLEFEVNSGIKWFQSSFKCSCRGSNRSSPYQIQRQLLLNQLTFGNVTPTLVM
jgi:hypothetical protein